MQLEDKYCFTKKLLEQDLPVHEFPCLLVIKEGNVLLHDGRKEVLPHGGSDPLSDTGQQVDVHKGEHRLQGIHTYTGFKGPKLLSKGRPNENT